MTSKRPMTAYEQLSYLASQKGFDEIKARIKREAEAEERAIERANALCFWATITSLMLVIGFCFIMAITT